MLFRSGNLYGLKHIETQHIINSSWDISWIVFCVSDYNHGILNLSSSTFISQHLSRKSHCITRVCLSSTDMNRTSGSANCIQLLRCPKKVHKHHTFARTRLLASVKLTDPSRERVSTPRNHISCWDLEEKKSSFLLCTYFTVRVSILLTSSYKEYISEIFVSLRLETQGLLPRTWLNGNWRPKPCR